MKPHWWAIVLLVAAACNLAPIGGSNFKRPIKRCGERMDASDKDKEFLDKVLPRDCGRRFIGNLKRISGGYSARLGEFPSYVRLDIKHRIQGNRLVEIVCGGTLIGRHHVLTAAHCLPANAASAQAVTTIHQNKMLLNQPQSDPPSLRYRAAKWCVAHKFDFSKNDTNPEKAKYDLAVIKLARPVRFNENVQPACLPHKPSAEWRSLRLVGLGASYRPSDEAYYPNATYPKQLKALPFVRVVECRVFRQHPIGVCLQADDYNGGQGGSSCGGDSGGPTYAMEKHRQFVVGVHSQGFNRCEPGLTKEFQAMDVHAALDKVAQLLRECQ